jgi:hypothetical protein
MRQRRCRRLRAAGGALALSLGFASLSSAQSSAAQEGALFLLLPVGARAVGMGQAVVADRTAGTEAVWWNPAGIGLLEKPQIALHHSQSIIGREDALTVVVPSSLLGVIALSANVLDYGAEESTTGDGTGGVPTGTVIPRSLVFSATYATSVLSHITVGITYKVLQVRVDCTGPCADNSSFSGSTSAVDLGMQYQPRKGTPLVVGVAVRNAGLKLQVNDNPQSDPIPRRLQLGAVYTIAPSDRYVRDLEIRLAADVLDELKISQPSVHVGTDVVYQKRAHVRAGYVFDDARSESGGPALGLGLESGRVSFDIARMFTGLSADAGQAPTYLSLRYSF